MRNIDWYINESLNRENISTSYTKAYSFSDDGVILVQYSKDRPNMDEVSSEIEKLNREGVNTPRYLDYKYVGDYCYVLQELEKGICFSEITRNHNLEFASNIPSNHYEKFIRDVIKMNGLGIELRPRNFFYDEEVGFTIIDIQGVYNSSFDSNSLVDVNFMFNHIYSGLNVNFENASNEELDKLEILNAKRKIKILGAFDNSLDGFSKFKRWILRNNFNVLSDLNKYGYNVSNLDLSEDEKSFFNELVSKYIDIDIEELLEGKDEFGRNNKSKVRNALEGSILFYDDYQYKDFDDNWDSIYLKKLSDIYLMERNNKVIEDELIRRIMRVIDPVSIYVYEVLYQYVKDNLDNYINGNLEFMDIRGSHK